MSLGTIGRVFCEGNSNVFELIDKNTNAQVVVKKSKNITSEQEIMRHLGRYSCIVDVKAFNDDAIVLESATCDLRAFMLDCSLHYTKKIIKSVLKALDFCHAKKIVHGDIKPENILIFKKGSKIRVKLCDFGLSLKLFPQIQNPRGSLGACILQTPYYRAPELMIPRELCADFMKRPTGVDLWSVGVVMTECLGRSLYPFDQYKGTEQDIHNMLLKRLIGENLEYQECVDKIVNVKKKELVGKLDIKRMYGDLVGIGGRRLLGALLRFNPNDRITAKKALAFRFITPKKPECF